VPARRSSWAVALYAFLANHVLLIVVSLLTGRLFYDVAGQATSLQALWERWDVLWYLRIANHGYAWYPPPIQSDVAFFPLYPLSMHVTSLLTTLPAYQSGLLVSNCCFFAALYVFHRLVLVDFDAETADRAVYYLAVFPTALFFFTAYSESLYLLCCVGCLYALRLRRWWLAGLCGMAACLTRQLGIMLVIPFAFELYGTLRYERRIHSWLEAASALLLVPAGVLCYITYLQVRFGDALLFLRAQEAWHRVFALPWQGLIQDAGRMVHLVGHFSMHTRNSLAAQSALEVAFALLFICLIAWGSTRLRPSYTAYACAVFLAVLMSPTASPAQPLALLSIERFEVTLFPPFITLAVLGRGRGSDRLITTLSVGLLVLFTIVFVRGRWIA
jgi:Gpi18-like mannosyltransferase